jgi:hypothetical protein
MRAPVPYAPWFTMGRVFHGLQHSTSARRCRAPCVPRSTPCALRPPPHHGVPWYRGRTRRPRQGSRPWSVRGKPPSGPVTQPRRADARDNARNMLAERRVTLLSFRDALGRVAAPRAEIPRAVTMRRTALGVRTQLVPQKDVTAAAPRQGAAKGVGPHREAPRVVRRDESIQGPGAGDGLHGCFLRTSR